MRTAQASPSPKKIRMTQHKKNKVWLEEKLAMRFAGVDILSWRAVAGAFGQVALTTLGSGRGHPKVRANLLLRGMAEEVGEGGQLMAQVRKELAAYNTAFCGFENAVSGLGAVLFAGAAEATSVILEYAEATQHQLDLLKGAVEALSDWKASRREVMSASKKKAAMRLQTVIKAFERSGTPATLTKFLVMSGMIAKPDGIEDSEWPGPPFEESSIPAIAGTSADTPEALTGLLPWQAPRRFILDSAVEGSVRDRKLLALLVG